MSGRNRITIQIEDEDLKAVQEVCALVGDDNLSNVVRVAMRLGLVELKGDPAKILTPPPWRVEALRKKARRKGRRREE